MNDHSHQDATDNIKSRLRSRTKKASQVSLGMVRVSSQQVELKSDASIESGMPALPRGFIGHLHYHHGSFWIKYANLERYCATHLYQPDLVDDGLSPTPTNNSTPNNNKLTIVLDITSYTPNGPTVTSFNVLPYIWGCLSFRKLHFCHHTENVRQGYLLRELLKEVIGPRQFAWEQYVLKCEDVSEVIVWWLEKNIDIVLKPGSVRALEWNCGLGEEEGRESRDMRKKLGLAGMRRTGWQGAVIVESVEGEA